MNSELELISKAQEILKEMAQGINPFTKERIEETNFLNDPKMIRCLAFCADMLDRAKVPVNNTNTEFIITKEQKESIHIPYDTIGFTNFSRIVNEIIDQFISKKASAHKIILSLKNLGIIGELINEKGKKTTITLPNSADYGFVTVHKSFNGREYDQVMANRQGQRYLIDNLEMLMGERGQI